MMLLIHLSIIFYKNKLVHGFYFHNTSPANFYLLHTHFFSLLVYHVPILSYNPTVYTLYTVSTWGSVYIRQNQLRVIDNCSGTSTSLLLSTGNLIWIFVQNIGNIQTFRNLFHSRFYFPDRNVVNRQGQSNILTNG